MSQMKQSRLVRIIPLIATAPLLGSPAFGKIIYVDDDAGSLSDGLSWQTAYKYLQDALVEAEWAEKPVEIRVAQGLYQPDRSSKYPSGTQDRAATFHLIDDLSLRGGFAGIGTPDPNARDVEFYRTILSGDLGANDVDLPKPLDARTDLTRKDNSYHVVSFNERGEIDAGLTAELDGLMIVGGQAQRHGVDRKHPWMGTPPEHGGGGLYLWSVPKRTTQVTVRDCVFDRNYAEERGGAVYAFAQGVRFVDCQFTHNATHMCGGAAYPDVISAEFVQCHFEDNHADGDGGGAIYCSALEMTLRGCAFTGNAAFMCGGGIRIDAGVVKCFDCIWWDNCVTQRDYPAIYGGGAIYISRGARLQAERCRLARNRSQRVGGAIMANGAGSLILTDCLLTGNAARGDGGVLWNTVGAVQFTNCSACGNRASGGQFVYDHTEEVGYSCVKINNSIISNGRNELWNNSAAITITYTCVSGGPASVHDPRGLVIWGPGDIVADPCFANTGEWDPNGTPSDPNDDFWVDGDYHLKSQAGRWDSDARSWIADDTTSLCIDAGDPNRPIGQEPFPNGGRINMGAYGGTAEASKSLSGVHGKYGGGAGRAENPYLLYTAEQMGRLAAEPDDWGRSFRLMADIDLSGYAGGQFDVIGPGAESPFAGVFDGDGHTISGFVGSGRVGMFGYVSGTIKNLGLVNPQVDGGAGYYVGALVGDNHGTVVNCYVEDANVAAGGWYAGGLVGRNKGTVADCRSTGTVSDGSAGGLVGLNSGAITGCNSAATVAGDDKVGGLVGEDSYGTVANSFSTGIVTGDDQTGGLIGYTSYSTVTGCYSAATITGNDGVGGLVGENSYGVITNCYSDAAVVGDRMTAGLVGSNGGGAIRNCYATGRVSGRWPAGGLVSFRYDDDTITGSFWDTQTTTCSWSAGGTGLTTGEMQTASTFLAAGWDFVGETTNGTEDIWRISERQDYPRLGWEPQEQP